MHDREPTRVRSNMLSSCWASQFRWKHLLVAALALFNSVEAFSFGSVALRGVSSGKLGCSSCTTPSLSSKSSTRRRKAVLSHVKMSGFFANIFGGGSDEDREDFERVVSAITAPSGWSVNMELGSQVARSLGGTGSLAKADVMNVNIGASIRMSRDEGYDPPQGSVFIESESSIFSGESFWFVTEDTDAGVPTAIQASLKCPQGIKVSGELVVPGGEIFLNFKVRNPPATTDGNGDETSGKRGEVEFYSGRVTVKEDVKSSFLLTPYDGLLAEFKVIGACAAQRRALPEAGGER